MRESSPLSRMLAPTISAPPWLSILLPVHGVEPFLPDCTRSLLSQELDGVELVFLDDASPDGSADLLRKLLDARPGWTRLLQHPTHRGISAARNTLLEAAGGEYVWFVDPDDVLEPGAVTRLRRIVALHRPDLVMCDFRVFDDGSGKPVERADQHVASFRGRSGVLSTDRDALLRGLFRTGRMHPWSKIVRRGAWPASLRFPEGRHFEDLSLLPSVAANLASYFHVPEIWVAYRKRCGSILGSLTPSKLDEWIAALVDGTAVAREAGAGLSERTRAVIADFCARTSMTVGELADTLAAPDGEARRRGHAELWRSACPWPARRVERAYWLTGRFGRALRWRRWRRRAEL